MRNLQNSVIALTTCVDWDGVVCIHTYGIRLISIFVIKGVFPIEVWVKIRTIIILLKRLIPIPTAIIIWKWSLKLRWHLLYRRRRQCSAIYRKLRFIIRLRLIRWTCRKILTLLMLLKMPLLLRVLCGLFCCCCCWGGDELLCWLFKTRLALINFLFCWALAPVLTFPCVELLEGGALLWFDLLKMGKHHRPEIKKLESS